MKILVIDDDVEILNSISSMLRKEGFIVESAINLSLGRKLLKNDHYDLVISDFMFQREDFSIENAVNEQPGEIKTPLILISGMDKESSEVCNKNIDTNLSKPFTNKQLLAEVNMILNPKKP